jgi:ribonuclease T2
MKQRRSRRTRSIATILGGAIAAVILGWFGLGPQSKPVTASAANEQRSAQRTGDSQPTNQTTRKSFDFYQLALSLAPAFCETEPDHAQCRKLNADADQRTPLTLHGLWPEFRGAGRFPSDCADGWDGDGFKRAATESERERLMPAGSRLARHEWQKHGTCSHSNVESYFREAFALTDQYSALLAPLINDLKNDARTMSASEFRSHANQLQSGLGASLVLVCKNLRGVDGERRGKAHLLEVRICLEKSASGAAGGPMECASADRIDQGCGRAFYIDTP